MAGEGIEAGGDERLAGGWRRGLAWVAALLVALLLVALVILVATSNRERDAALARERHSYDVMVIMRALDASMARSEAALGRFVISGDRTTGSIYYDEWRRAGFQLRRLQSMTAGDTRQAYLVGQLKALYAQRGQELALPASHAAYKQGWPALSSFNEAGKSLSLPRIAEIMERIGDNERAQLEQRSSHAAATVARSNFLAALLSAIGILLVLGAIALGWSTAEAMAQRRRARRDADQEAERVEELEGAVAERTRALVQANERLRQEVEERALAEAKLRQVQKMEAVGQLTGGIAHDFNNMLAVVVGGLDLARRRVNVEADELGRHIDNAMEGAKRAAQLTRRLLAFARAEPLMPEGVDPASLIGGMSDLLDRSLGERIRVEIRIEPGVWSVWCDPNQLENAILNLAVNARDAMEGEGSLGIAVDNVALADGVTGEAKAGDYVRIMVTDRGCGMTPEILERVFEPFFTTKPVGKGTGLGLSQIFGFARQSGGEVVIDSTPGAGTTVSLYLPRFARAANEGSVRPATIMPATPALPAAAGATILVVEDDARVRGATMAALNELGHSPIAAAGGEEAIAILAARNDIGLILSDVLMPGMTGPELIAKVGPLYPHIAILYLSGYVGEAGDADLFAGHEVLRKPFTLVTLERAVTQALANRPRASAPREHAA